MWCVIIFIQEDNLAVIPKSWFIEESQECLWPPKNSHVDITKFVKQKYLPEDTWKPYKARILGIYDTYDEAVKKCNKAQDNDNLSSTDFEGMVGRRKRKRKQNTKYIAEKSDSCNSYDGEDSDSEGALSYPSIENLEPVRSIASSFIREESSLKTISKSANTTSQSSFINCSQESEKLSNKYNKKLSKTAIRRTLSRSLSPEVLRPEYEKPNKTKNLFQQNAANTLSTIKKPKLIETGKVKIFENRNMVERHFADEMLEDSCLPNQSAAKDSDILTMLHAINANSAEFRQQVLRKLNLINLKLNDLSDSVEKIKNTTSDVDVDPNEDLLNILNLFPLDKEKLDSVEEFLTKTSNQKLLAKELSRVGGSDTKEIVRRLMYKLFTNDLGTLFSWDGAKKKKKFKNLYIASTILDAVRYNKSTKDSTEAEIILYIKKWLVRSKDRMELCNKKRTAVPENPVIMDH